MIHKRIRIFALRVVSRPMLEVGHVICHVNDAIMMNASPNPYPLPSFQLGYAREISKNRIQPHFLHKTDPCGYP